MSRTIKGKKPIGWEFWSRRPKSRNHGYGPGKKAKKVVHSLERCEEKELIRKILTKEE